MLAVIDSRGGIILDTLLLMDDIPKKKKKRHENKSECCRNFLWKQNKQKWCFKSKIGSAVSENFKTSKECLELGLEHSKQIVGLEVYFQTQQKSSQMDFPIKSYG